MKWSYRTSKTVFIDSVGCAGKKGGSGVRGQAAPAIRKNWEPIRSLDRLYLVATWWQVRRSAGLTLMRVRAEKVTGYGSS